MAKINLEGILSSNRTNFVNQALLSTALLAEKLPELPVDDREEKVRKLNHDMLFAGSAEIALFEAMTGTEFRRPVTPTDVKLTHLAVVVPIKREFIDYGEDNRNMDGLEFGKPVIVTNTSKFRVRDGSKDGYGYIGGGRISNRDYRAATNEEVEGVVDALLANRPASTVKLFSNNGDEELYG